MKLVKLSLITAVLVGSSAFAISHVKVAGDAELFYSSNTNNSSVQNEGIFGANNSYGQAALHLGLTADLTKGISAGASMTALSSLGLQGQLVSDVWEGTNSTTDSYIVNTAWLAGAYGKTTAKIGRMKLNTPLIYSEDWSLMSNTFESVVLLNQNIPNTTLITTYVGGSNGSSLYNQNGNNYLNFNTNPATETKPISGLANRIQGTKNNSTFSQFYNGVYAVGVINNSLKPLKVQAWYYNAPQYLQDWWLEADFNMNGIIFGAQYTGINYDFDAITKNLKDSNNAYAFKLGYKIQNIATITGAISKIGKNSNNLGAGENLAELGNNAQSKLYTEAWWNYGYVTRANTTAENITITSPVNGLFDLGLYWIHTSRPGYSISSTDLSYRAGSKVPTTDNNHNDGNMNELTATISKSFGKLDTIFAYIFTKAGDLNNNVGFSTAQVYLTYNF